MRKYCNVNRYFILLIFLLSVGRTFGQTDDELAIQAALQARTTTDIENADFKYKFFKEHWDLLNSGIVQSNYQLGRKKKFERIGLMTLSINSVIIYSEVYRWDFNERWFDDEGNEPPWIHQILDFRSEEQFHELNLNLEHLTRLPGQSTFGYACGAAAQMPIEGQLMMNFVEDQNITELTKWLNCVNPVRQVFAYLGLSLLEAREEEIDSATRTKMDQLDSSDFLVYSCSGCTVWEPTPFSELLTEEKVKRFVNRKME
jgi:hypothetical protein